LSPRHRHASPHPRHELSNPCHVLQSPPLTSPSSASRSIKPTPSDVGFCRRRSASCRRPLQVLVRCRRSVLELHHNASMPTILTTGSTHRSSGLALMTPFIEPPSPLRALSGEPLLPEIPQSGYPRCHVALAVISDPPHRRLTPKSGRPMPPLLLAPWVFPRFTVGRQPEKKPCALGPALAEARVGHCAVSYALSSVPWAT
jgi:hypothetical protein